MNDSLWLLAKVMGGSAVGAIAIKYFPPLALVPAKVGVVWAIVLTPTAVLALLLGWLTWRSGANPNPSRVSVAEQQPPTPNP
ncbi:MAG: hypothetical protein Fur0046_39010 [Cyanobacteria bacterium J069]